MFYVFQKQAEEVPKAFIFAYIKTQQFRPV